VKLVFNRKNEINQYQGKQRDVHGTQDLERSRIEGPQKLGGVFASSIFLGLVVVAITWFLLSVGSFAGAQVMGKFQKTIPDGVTAGQIVEHKGLYGVYDTDGNFSTYMGKTKTYVDGQRVEVYQGKDSNGLPDVDTQYKSADEVPVPEWFKKKQQKIQELEATGIIEQKKSKRKQEQSVTYWVKDAPDWKLWVSGIAGLIAFGSIFSFRANNIQRKNKRNDTKSLMQYADDQHIQQPLEMFENYHVVPNSGAHFTGEANSLLGHAHYEFKTKMNVFMWLRYSVGQSIVSFGRTGFGSKVFGVFHIKESKIREWARLPKLKHVKRYKRYKEDTVVDGETIFKGDFILDKDGNRIFESVPIIDEVFGTSLFEASNTPDIFRRRFNPFKIPYNPGGKNRDKVGKYKTLADLINGDWEFPPYEVQTPSGGYFVDTAPVNTMVLAITRAGKGQTYIEPLLDIWSREKRKHNIIVNDPKGELSVKFMVPFENRGYEVLQLNLINTMGTAIYNPLGLAGDAAREGNMGATASYVNNIAETFFPTEGGQDPFWPQAANNAFKRAAFGLIDYFLEEEKVLVADCKRKGMRQSVIDQKIDELWGRVTLYNCYQLFTQLSSKKRKNPNVLYNPDDPEFANMNDADKEAYEERLKFYDDYIWEGNKELDLLSLYFNATAQLPRNRIRNEVLNTDATLKAMGGSEKTIASVYGIAITQMVFFTDPTISAITSGAPSQNVDMGSLSFPRRMSVKFDVDYVRKLSLKGLLGEWTAYEDPGFTKKYGKEFDHFGLVTMDGWSEYMFDGKFPNDVAYVRLQLKMLDNDMVVKSFYFKFTKGYRTSPNGRMYVKSPILQEKIVRNGSLEELQWNEELQQAVPGYTMIKKSELYLDIDEFGDMIDMLADVDVPVISMSKVRYTERPKAIFMITPPHLKGYAKLLLIFISQQTELNFEKAYLTKANQKPLYKTRWMLDELGNLESDGSGIKNFMTYLSIGLGQDQQFTLILQVLQQLKDVYGDSKDKVAQGNTANIIFLKSTDDTSIDAVSKMSGTTHKVFNSSRTNNIRVVAGVELDSGSVSETMSASEVPVLSYNDLAFISPSNSVVLRAGDSPIWNRNETALPMAYKLQGADHKIPSPGKDYSLSTLPTMSTTKDFDLLQNIPNFFAMVDKRILQAYWARMAKEKYMEAYEHTDESFMRVDQDISSDAIMSIVNQVIQSQDIEEIYVRQADNEDYSEQIQATNMAREQFSEFATPRFAMDGPNGIAPNDIIAVHGSGGEARLDGDMIGNTAHLLEQAYKACYGELVEWVATDGRRSLEIQENGSLWTTNNYGKPIEIFSRVSTSHVRRHVEEAQALAELNGTSDADSKKVITQEDLDELNDTLEFKLTYAGAKWFAKQKNWGWIAHRKFENTVIQLRRADNEGV
jgi:hypothetical protein